jgi:hypothetical protein
MRRSSRHAKQSPGYYANMVNGGRYCGEDADAGSSESGSSEEELVPTSEKVVASEEQEGDFEASDDESSGESISSDDEPKPKKRSRGRPRKVVSLAQTKPNGKKRWRRGQDPPQDPEAAAPRVIEIRLHQSLKASKVVRNQIMKFKVCSCPQVLSSTERLQYPDGCSFDDVFDMVNDCGMETIDASAGHNGELDVIWSNSIYAWKETRKTSTKPLSGKAEAFEIKGEDDFNDYMEMYAYKGANSKNNVIVDIACWVKINLNTVDLLFYVLQQYRKGSHYNFLFLCRSQDVIAEWHMASPKFFYNSVSTDLWHGPFMKTKPIVLIFTEVAPKVTLIYVESEFDGVQIWRKGSSIK